jgi:hypothetical protein
MASGNDAVQDLYNRLRAHMLDVGPHYTNCRDCGQRAANDKIVLHTSACVLSIFLGLVQTDVLVPPGTAATGKTTRLDRGTTFHITPDWQARVIDLQQELLSVTAGLGYAATSRAELYQALRTAESLFMLPLEPTPPNPHSTAYSCMRCGTTTTVGTGLMLHADWCPFSMLEKHRDRS